MCWFLFLLLSLTLTHPIIYELSSLQIMYHRLHLPNSHTEMKHPSYTQHLNHYFGLDLLNEGVVKDRLSQIAQPLSVSESHLHLCLLSFWVRIKALKLILGNFILEPEGFSLSLSRLRGYGYGALTALLEVMIWVQLGIHDEPVGFSNVDGSFNLLLSFIDKAIDVGFISLNAWKIFASALTAK